MNEYDYFNGSDPDIAKWGEKRVDDEFQSQVEPTEGEWFLVRGSNGKFMQGIAYRRKKKAKFSYPTRK